MDRDQRDHKGKAIDGAADKMIADDDDDDDEDVEGCLDWRDRLDESQQGDYIKPL